jgi:hypothetical protein
VIKDILFYHPALDAISDILLVQDKFRILRHDDKGEQDNCNRQSAFKCLPTTSVVANKNVCVAVHLYDGAMVTIIKELTSRCKT